MRFASALLAAAALSACASPTADFERLCHAHERAGVTPSDDPAQRAVKIAGWIGENVTSKEAKQIMRELPLMDPKDKGAALTAAAAKVGVSPCPLADATWNNP